MTFGDVRTLTLDGEPYFVGKGMEASKISAKEAREFIELLKRLDEEEQAGLLLMLQGARVIKGTAFSRPSEHPAPSSAKTP